MQFLTVMYTKMMKYLTGMEGTGRNLKENGKMYKHDRNKSKFPFQDIYYNNVVFSSSHMLKITKRYVGPMWMYFDRSLSKK